MALYVVDSEDAALQRAGEIVAAQLTQAIQQRRAAPALELQAAVNLTDQRGSPLTEEEFTRLYPRAAKAGLYPHYQQAASELLRRRANLERAWLVSMANTAGGQVAEQSQRVFQQASTAISELLATKEQKQRLMEAIQRAKGDLARVQLQLANNRTVSADRFAELMGRFVISSDQNVAELALAALRLMGVQAPTTGQVAETASAFLSAFRQMAGLMGRESLESDALRRIVTSATVDLATNSGIGVSVDSGAQLLDEVQDPAVASAVVRNWMSNMVKAVAQGQDQQALQYWLAARLVTDRMQANKDAETSPREVKQISKQVQEVMSGSASKPGLIGRIWRAITGGAVADEVARQYAEEFKQDLQMAKQQLQQLSQTSGGQVAPQEVLGKLGFQQLAPALIPQMRAGMEREQAAARGFESQALKTAQQGVEDATAMNAQMSQEYQKLEDAIAALSTLKQNVHTTQLTGPGGEQFPLQYSTFSSVPLGQLMQAAPQKKQLTWADVMDFLLHGGEGQ